MGRASLTGGSTTSGLGEQFGGDLTELSARSGRVQAAAVRIRRGSRREATPDVSGCVLDAATLAVEATRLESALTGGAAYRLGSAPTADFAKRRSCPSHHHRKDNCRGNSSSTSRWASSSSVPDPAGRVDLDVVKGNSSRYSAPRSGKSTLLRVLAGLESLTDGDIGPARRRYPPGTGVVFQQPLLMPWLTVRENILFANDSPTARRLRSDRILRAVRRFRLGSCRSLPDQLSGGQAQPVSVLRAVAAQPRLLLLDDRSARWTRQPGPSATLAGGELAAELDVTVVLVT